MTTPLTHGTNDNPSESGTTPVDPLRGVPDDRWTPEPPRETPAAKRTAARVASRLAYHENRAVCDTCKREGNAAVFYRCRWCGVYFCATCSSDHFAKSDGLKAEEAERARDTALAEVDRLRARVAELEAAQRAHENGWWPLTDTNGPTLPTDRSDK